MEVTVIGATEGVDEDEDLTKQGTLAGVPEEEPEEEGAIVVVHTYGRSSWF